MDLFVSQLIIGGHCNRTPLHAAVVDPEFPRPLACPLTWERGALWTTVQSRTRKRIVSMYVGREGNT